MRWIFISPHLDDAILSLGGFIYDQVVDGKEIEIWTVACGFPDDENISPFARKLHSQWGFNSAVETIRSRREEDKHAAEIVGALPVHLDFLDCIYRRGHDGAWLYDINTFVPPHADETEFSNSITNDLIERLKPDDQLVCPLAIGGHVDHVICKHAVESIGRPLLYYADFPYLLDNPSALDVFEKTMHSSIYKISRIGLIAWQNSAGSYISQISMEFETRRKLQKAISNYGKKNIKLWRLP